MLDKYVHWQLAVAVLEHLLLGVHLLDIGVVAAVEVLVMNLKQYLLLHLDNKFQSLLVHMTKIVPLGVI